MKLTDYIQSNRRGKDANDFEQKALQDPFMKDALNGYDLISGNHAQSIKDIEKRLISNRKPSFGFHPYLWWIVGLAAYLVFSLGILFFWYWNEPFPVITQMAPQIVPIQPTPPVIDFLSWDTDSIKPIPPQVAAVKRRKKKEKQPKTEVQPVPVIQTAGEVITISSDDVSALKPVQESKAELVYFHEEIAKSEQKEIDSQLTGHVAAGPSVKSQSLYGAKKEVAQQTHVLGGSKLMGRIVDESGAPLAGATVRLQNQMYAAVADINGNFQLQSPRNPEDTLIFNYIGYKSRKLALGTDLELVQLEPFEGMHSEVAEIRSSSKNKSGDTAPTKVSIGKVEFEAFFYKLCAPDLCNSAKQSITAHFMINTAGRPVDVVIEDCSCYDLRTEFVRLLKISPVWRYTDQPIKIKLTVNDN